MSNMLDYLNWRGDIPFSVSPFNEIDNLILAEMAYVPFDHYVPDMADGSLVSIQEVSEKFFQDHSEQDILDATSSSIAKAPLVLKACAESERFKDTKLSCFVNEIETDNQVQFSAVCFHLPDHTVYVSFRGTDHTIVGWKEDFNMSFLSKTPGQERAALYLNQIGARPFRRLRVGGHSKGGNFAVYGSCFCQPKVQKKIIAVYSNDGPGFRKEITSTKEYESMLPKIYSIVPEHTIVGMILNNAYSHKIIESTGTGLMQHDALTWQVYGRDFVEKDQLGDDSKVFADALKNWLSDVSDENRAEFVDILFDAITSDGSTTTEDLAVSYGKTLKNMYKSVNKLPKEKQALFGDVLVKLAKSFNSAMDERFFSRK